MFLGGFSNAETKVIQEMDRNVIETFEESPMYLHTVHCFDLYKIKLCICSEWELQKTDMILTGRKLFITKEAASDDFNDRGIASL